MRNRLLGGISLAALVFVTPFSSPAMGQDSPLADTKWQLVSIQSMDDNTYTPKDGTKYTLTLDADRSAAILSDCNRLQGNWSSQGPAHLTFSALAGTLALCGPDSLDERYRFQFDWVRSYVLREGQLYLATEADGSIVEFSPLKAPPVVARLMGDDLRSTNPEAVQMQILDRLFDGYVSREGLSATDAEVSAYLGEMDRTLRERLGEEAESMDGLSAEEQAELQQGREGMARGMIERWKLNKSLYAEYGGRVIYQQMGPEPLDAYRTYLRARHEAGDFAFLDEKFEAAFWRYFEDESKHDFYPPDEATNIFGSAPWED